MNTSQQIEQVEVSIEEAKKQVELGAAIRRLESNSDFRKVISETYFRDEAARLAHMSALFHLGKDKLEHINQQIRAIGELAEFLRIKKMLAESLEGEIKAHQETLDDLRLEQAEG